MSQDGSHLLQDKMHSLLTLDKPDSVKMHSHPLLKMERLTIKKLSKKQLLRKLKKKLMMNLIFSVMMMKKIKKTKKKLKPKNLKYLKRKLNQQLNLSSFSMSKSLIKNKI